jgi:hypothetical protein
MMVGPSWVFEANVIVQFAPIARLLPQVVLLILLPPGIVAVTLFAEAEELVLLVTVTVPVEFSAISKINGLTEMVTPTEGLVTVIFKLSVALGR